MDSSPANGNNASASLSKAYRSCRLTPRICRAPLPLFIATTKRFNDTCRLNITQRNRCPFATGGAGTKTCPVRDLPASVRRPPAARTACLRLPLRGPIFADPLPPRGTHGILPRHHILSGGKEGKVVLGGDGRVQWGKRGG